MSRADSTACSTAPVIAQVVVDHFYVALFSAFEQTRSSFAACDSEWVTLAFYRAVLNTSGLLTGLVGCDLIGATWNCCHLGACSVYTIRPRMSLQCHLMQSHICGVHVCLAVTCHLHLWQNGQDLLCATGVTQGWKRYPNKSQHRKLTLEKKITPPLLLGLKPVTFQSLVWLPLSYPCS